MSNFIFISKISQKETDYIEIKESFEKVFKNFSSINKCCNKLLDATLFEKRILLINGIDFQNTFKWKQNNNFPDTNSYDSLIENIKKIYDEIKNEYNNTNDNNTNAEKLKEFEEVFKPNETIICIHWGGSTNYNEAINKFVEEIRRKGGKKEEVFSVTYFSSTDGDYYTYLTKKDSLTKEELQKNIKIAFEFYKMRAQNLHIKKKIYEIMETIFIYGFGDYLEQTSKEYKIENKDGKIYDNIIKDIEFLELEKSNIFNLTVKKAMDDFFALVRKENGEILIPNIQSFRSKTYKILNQIEVPIYPKPL